VLCLIVIWNTSGAVSQAARHGATAGLGVLPLGLRVGIPVFKRSSQIKRALLSATALVYLGLPLLYGPCSVAVKIWRPQGYIVARSGLYNPLLAPRNAAACAASLSTPADSADELWYLIDPNSALDVHGRSIIVQADFLAQEALASYHFRSSQHIRIRAMLPEHFEPDGKGALIRSSFAGASSWTRIERPACANVEWTAELAPSSSADSSSN